MKFDVYGHIEPIITKIEIPREVIVYATITKFNQNRSVI
jgi:hypothetical protein